MPTIKEKQEQLLKQAAEDGAKNCGDEHCERGSVRPAEERVHLGTPEKDSHPGRKEPLTQDEIIYFLDILSGRSTPQDSNLDEIAPG